MRNEKLSERGVAAVVGGVKKRHQRSARHGYDPDLVGQFGRARSSGLFVRHCVPSILRSMNVIIELPLLTTTSNVIACDNKRILMRNTCNAADSAVRPELLVFFAYHPYQYWY